MTAYIKVSTLEYPLYSGDLITSESGDYEPVEVTIPEELKDSNKTGWQITPEKINGKWVSRWFIRDKTPEEIEERKRTEARIRARYMRREMPPELLSANTTPQYNADLDNMSGSKPNVIE